MFDSNIPFIGLYLEVYPFDKVSKELIEELRKRDFKVPNINVRQTMYYGKLISEGPKYQCVQRVSGKGFQINFDRIQGTMPESENYYIGAVSSISYNNKILSVDNKDNIHRLCVFSNNKLDLEHYIDELNFPTFLSKYPKPFEYFIGFDEDTKSQTSDLFKNVIPKVFAQYDTENHCVVKDSNDMVKCIDAIESYKEAALFIENVVLNWIKLEPVSENPAL